MPSPEAILASLKLAANDWLAVAVLWHVAAVALIVAIVAGWRPSRRLAGALLSTPVASAAIVAFAYRNPFNGSVLGVLTVGLAATAWRFDRSPARMRSISLAIVGAAMVGFGLFYPHFLDGSPAIYLVAAPAGLIPCPTLSLVIGFTLMSGGLGSAGWSLPLSVVGLFYGLFGIFRLGVMLDVGLVAGAGSLLALTVRWSARRAHAASAG